MGAEKFVDIKCRKSGLRPAAVVVVATLRALKYHGGVELRDVGRENLDALERGLANLERHVSNVRERYGLPCVVSVNQFAHDTDAEFALLKARLQNLSVEAISARHWAEGGVGALQVARAVVELTARPATSFRFVFEDDVPLWDIIRAVATVVYGAADVAADPAVLAEIARLQKGGYGHYPICIAKTQYSFSTDAQVRGAPTGHILQVREVRLAAGAEFIVFVCGDILTMPGLPKLPSANHIDIDASGKVVGLF